MKKRNYYPAAIILILLAYSVAAVNAQSPKKETEIKNQDSPSKISMNTNRVEVPMQIYSRKPVVEVKINDQGPYKFFLDTGASATVLDQSLVTELKLPFKGTIKLGDPKSPQAIDANQNWIEKLEIGDIRLQEFIAVSWDRSNLYKEGSPRGVLGMPLFKKLLLTINYPQNKIAVTKDELPKANGMDILNFQYSEADLFGVPLNIAGNDYLATLDTGSAGGLSFPNSFMDKLPLDSKPVEVGRARSVAGESIIYGAKISGNVKIGNYQFENPQIAFFDRLTHINIGFDFLRQFAITVDQKNRRLKFEKTAATVNSENTNQTVSKAESLDEYAGQYGERKVTVENGVVYLQRVTGPQGAGPKIQLSQVTRDEFALPGTNIVRVKFIRNQMKEISEIQVLTPQGNWESSRKGM